MKGENKRILIIGFITIVIVVGAVIIALLNNDEEVLVNDEGTEEVEQEEQEETVSNLNSIYVDEFVELFNGEELSIIYIARPTCGYCVQFKPVLEKVVEDYSLTVNYIDIDELDTDAEKAKYNGVHDYIPENGWSTPQILIVKDGGIFGINGGAVDEATLIEFLIKYDFIEED